MCQRPPSAIIGRGKASERLGALPDAPIEISLACRGHHLLCRLRAMKLSRYLAHDKITGSTRATAKLGASLTLEARASYLRSADIPRR